MQTRWRGMAVLAGTAMALAGCGGASTLSNADLIAAVTDLCAETNERMEEAEASFEDDTPEGMVTAFAGMAEAFAGFASDVSGLEASDDDAPAVAALVSAFDDLAEGFRGVAEGIEGGGDPDELIGPAFAGFASAQAAASELGIGSLESCGEDEVVADPDATRVDVVASDYAFEIGEVQAGRTAFVLTNEGTEMHYMGLSKLADGTTVEQAMESEDPDAEGLIVDIGDTAAVAGGGTAVLNVEDLEPGNYVLTCFIPDVEGTPHAFLGMVEEFTVAE